MIESEKPIGSKERCFLADIYSSDEELIAQGIRCRLILNEIGYTEPITLLYPTSKKEYDAITAHSQLSIKGYLENAAGEKTWEVFVSKGHFDSEIAHFGASWNEYIVEVVFPEEIYQKSHLGIQNQDKSRIFFFLNDNRIFSRTLVTPPCYPAVAQALPKVILNIGDGWTARFERHYSHVGTKIEGVKGGYVSGHLVLALEKDNYQLSSVDDVKPISDLVSRLLLFLSFAGRQRSIWVKWCAVIGTDHVQYYRKISVEYSGYSLGPLVEPNSTQEFLQHCLEYRKDADNL